MDDFLTSTFALWLYGVAVFALAWPIMWLHRYIREDKFGRMPKWYV